VREEGELVARFVPADTVLPLLLLLPTLLEILA